MVLHDQGISLGPQRFMFLESLLTGDSKATFNQATLDIGLQTVLITSKKYSLKLPNMCFQHILSTNRRGIYVGT